MDVELLFVQSQKTGWVEEALAVYSEKIGHQIKFKSIPLKSKKMDREDSGQKVEAESQALLRGISKDDLVILFDEHGQVLGSLDFAAGLRKRMDQGAKRIKLVIGGAFGVSEELKKRSNWTISLSKMTFNHHVALIVALEQVYRATLIWKGRPYHNE